MQIRLDHGEFSGSVQEVTAPWAEHDVHGEGDGAAAAEQLADARRRATLEQAVAQLDTRRTARLGSDRGGDAVGAHLQPGRPGGAGARPVAVAPRGEERGACSHGGGTSDQEEAGVPQLASGLWERDDHTEPTRRAKSKSSGGMGVDPLSTSVSTVSWDWGANSFN